MADRDDAPLTSDPATELARLRWRSRRGMRELDAVLAGFLDSEFAHLNAADRRRMAAILDLPDPELHAFLVGRAVPEDPGFADLIRRIRGAFVPPA